MAKADKRRKKAGALPSLDIRKRKYVAGRLSGKSKKDSALEAGFSPAMARNAAAKIENLSVRRAFQELARKAVPAGKILKRLKEGLDATWVHQDGKRGTSVEPYYRERREYLILAAKLGGYYIEKKDVDAEVTVNDADVAARRQRVEALVDRLVEMETENHKMKGGAPPANSLQK